MRIIMIALAVIIPAFATNVWAANFDSLASFNKAPKVKEYGEAWGRCGQNGDSCPDKKSVADALRLRKEAIQDCFTTIGENAPDQVGPCKAAVGATPAVFSMKSGGGAIEPVRPAKPPVVVTKPPDPEPETVRPPEPVRAEPQPELPKPPVVPKPLEPDAKALTVVTHQQPPTPSANVPGWLFFITWWNFTIGIVGFGLFAYFWKNRGAKPAEASSAENVTAKALRGKSEVLQWQIEVEQQMLENLKSANPQDPVEIERVAKRIDILDQNHRGVETALEQLQASLKDAANDQQ